MKRLLLTSMLCALFALPASAQTNPDAYRLITPAHVQSITASGSTSITSGIVGSLIRVTCSVHCYFVVAVSGNTLAATKATGEYLPANTPRLIPVSPGSKVRVIGDTAVGTLHVHELSR